MLRTSNYLPIRWNCVYYWLRVVFEKMDIQSTYESALSGWHVFESNADRFALSSQVHGTKPIDNLLEQTSISQR